MSGKLSRTDYQLIDFSDPKSLFAHAKKLEGHTFQEVLDAGIAPETSSDDKDYVPTEYKGGMGNLVEERWFGYKANSNAEADFPEAGIELKTTCYDMNAKGEIRAGERLVLGMIAYDESIETELEESHMWDKSNTILLIYYSRDKEIERLEQTIGHVALFTPPEEDMAIIREDYKTIQKLVVEGRADELSESLTHYLGACTKGANSVKGNRDQSVYAPGKSARSRAWCFKQSYMNSILNDYIIGNGGGDAIIKDIEQLKGKSFEECIVSLLEPYIGMADVEIAEKLNLKTGPKNKSFWKMIAFRLLGLDSERASEFEKANIKARTVRIEKNASVKESFPLPTFKFADLAAEDEWEDSELYSYFDETRYFLTVFESDGDVYRLKGARFWSMPAEDINGPLHDCWLATRDKVRNGVTFTKRMQKNKVTTISNDLPGMSDNPIAHVRPHTSKSAYKLADGTGRGDIDKHGDRLPDGQWMTKQSFWLNNTYILGIVKNLLE